MSSDLQVVYILMNTLERQYGTLFLQEEGTFFNTDKKGWENDEKDKNVDRSFSVYESSGVIRM